MPVELPAMQAPPGQGVKGAFEQFPDGQAHVVIRLLTQQNS
jgi:hypothetical protein